MVAAKDVKVGQRIKLDGGGPVCVTANKVTRKWRMALPGHADRCARLVVFAGGRSFELFHPEEKVEVVA
jgi:hypothetical protein